MGKLFSEFFEGLFNIFIFLPYYFSVPQLIRNLLAPWKNIVAKKTTAGFSPSEWFSRLSLNLISRGMGFVMRLSLIIAFLLLQMVYIIALPFIILVFLLLSPLLYSHAALISTKDVKKQRQKERFIKLHVLDKRNTDEALRWFEREYVATVEIGKWWKLERLFSILPLARDWTAGYTPILDLYCEELTTSGYQNSVQNAIDRKKEIEAIEAILARNAEANVVLVGEEGIGKHTIVDALAKQIYNGTINPLLIYKRILKVNMEKILNEFTDQKQRELFMESLLKEAREAKNIILLIENFDRYVSTVQDRIDVSIPIEKFAKTPDLHFIAITTPFLYQKCIVPNDKISRIFTKVDVDEIGKAEALEILLHTALLLEKRSGVTIPYETVANAIEKSEYYISHIPFPEKAISLLDTVASYAKSSVITPQMVDETIEKTTHVPTKIDSTLRNTLLTLSKKLSDWILFQPQSVSKITSTLQSSFLLLGKRKKPLASFLFLGPTGVGKTETAKALSIIMFGNESHLIRFDMSNYQLKENIPQLIGSLDERTPGLLAQKVQDVPYGILLLDEIEKANKDLVSIFLSILDEGYFTDGFGKRIDCKHLIIIATSNAGSDLMFKSSGNFTSVPLSQDELIQYIVDKHYFLPEFLNRFDGIILYQQLNKQAIQQLAKKLLQKRIDTIYTLHKVKVTVSDKTLSLLIEKEFKPEWGARNLERALSEIVEAKVAQAILEGKAKQNVEI